VSLIPDRLRTSRPLRWGLAGVGVLLTAALVGLAAWAWHGATEARGHQALADALAAVEEAQRPSAPAEARERATRALEGFVAAHSGHSALPQVAYRLGNLRFEARQYPAARGAYELALASGAAGTLRSLAAIGLAYTWEAERDLGRAAAAFETALGGLGPRDALFEEALVDLARVQAATGKSDAAVQSYQRLLKERPDSSRADEIRTLLASLRTPRAR
jgi:tetratricopeptide (TPR) repeat protein